MRKHRTKKICKRCGGAGNIYRSKELPSQRYKECPNCRGVGIKHPPEDIRLEKLAKVQQNDILRK